MKMMKTAAVVITTKYKPMHSLARNTFLNYMKSSKKGLLIYHQLKETAAQ